MYSFVIIFAVIPAILSNPIPGLSKAAIVGGRKTKIIPYQVSIEHVGHHCGGSIISRRIVVTAAHCMVYDVDSLWVRAGTRTRNQDGQLVEVIDYVIHPNYNATNFDYDIAILYLKNDLLFDKMVHLIPMANANEFLSPGTMATISGWGYKREDSVSGTRILMEAEVPIVSQETCMSSTYNWTDRMICAGYRAGKIDACTEDSGGPLVVDRKLFGVISSGIGCARPNRVGGYVSIPVLRSWIDGIISTLKRRNQSFWEKYVSKWVVHIFTSPTTRKIMQYWAKE